MGTSSSLSTCYAIIVTLIYIIYISPLSLCISISVCVYRKCVRGSRPLSQCVSAYIYSWDMSGTLASTSLVLHVCMCVCAFKLT